MLDDAFAHFKSQIQAAKGGVTQLKVLDDPQRVQVVIEEKAMLAHGGVERLFAGVPEGRVADVVDQGQGFDQVDVQAELGCDGSGDLRHFDGVGQAVAKVVGKAPGKNLGLGLQTAKSPRVDDAVAVPLKIIAIGMLGLGKTASAGLLHPHGVVGQHGGSLALWARHSAIGS